MNRLVDNWANVNLANADGQTPLHFAAIGGKSTHLLIKYLNRFFLQISKTFFFLFQDNTKIAKLLIDLGSNPNAPDKDGNTPAHIASRYGSFFLL